MFNSFSFENNNYFVTSQPFMCFLKTLKSLEQIQFEKESGTDESSTLEIPRDGSPSSFLNTLLASNTPLAYTKQDILLQSLMTLITSNNHFLINIQNKLRQSEQSLINSHNTLQEMIYPSNTPSFTQQAEQCQIRKNLFDEESTPSHPLLTQLFGAQRYNYKLQLQQPVPSIIYKERNINIAVNLIDKRSERVLNSNIIHLCLGVCDASGNWITENKAGDNFMKGKTEVEMYHGEGAFLKVYPRDISRGYKDGKINFVVYSKPSMIKFSTNSTNVQRMVDSSEVEPLLISDIIVRAKKI